MILTAPIKILIADNHFLIREGLKKTLEGLNDIVLAGEIQCSHEIKAKVKQLHPDILLMEITLCETPMKELVREISGLSPDTKIMIISDCKCELPVIASIQAGI